MPARPIEVADGVHLCTGTDVNWFLLREGDDLTLVDAGYPGDTADVERSITAIGRRPEDVRAILLTHAHVDHTGAINHFHRRYGTPVRMDPVEVAHARRDHLESAGPAEVVRNLWRPGVAGWTLRIVRAGATRDEPVPHAAAFPQEPATGEPLDLPGRPVPIATHGHTSGHSAYYLPAVGAVLTGDGLVTGHATSRTKGPQLLGDMFNHSGADTLAALAPLAGLAADVLLPGHGPAHRGPIADAVATARERVSRAGRAP